MHSKRFLCAFVLLFSGLAGSSLRGQTAFKSGGQATTAAFASRRTDARYADYLARDAQTQTWVDTDNGPGTVTPIVNRDGPESVESLQLTDLKGIKPNSVILFQGDSITDGGRQRSGSDYNHAMGQDHAYILSALIGVTYPERNLTFMQPWHWWQPNYGPGQAVGRTTRSR